MDNYPESDWKLFRVKIVEWQENYIKRTNKILVKILTDEKLSSADRFWKAEKMIYREKNKTSIVADMRRSTMLLNILKLYKEKSITLEDLSDFSEQLQNDVKRIVIDS